MGFIKELRAHLAEQDAIERANTPRPSRNKHGVTAMDVCRLDPEDIVEATFSNLPNGIFRGPLQGAIALYTQHPTDPTAYLIIRDETGAPGPTLTSIAFIACGCGGCDEPGF